MRRGVGCFRGIEGPRSARWRLRFVLLAATALLMAACSAPLSTPTRTPELSATAITQAATPTAEAMFTSSAQPSPSPAGATVLQSSCPALTTPTITPIPTLASSLSDAADPAPPTAIQQSPTETPAPAITDNQGPTPEEEPVEVLPTATPLPPPPTETPTPVPPPAPRDGRVVLAYYVPYDGSSWAALEAHADSIDYLAAQWVSIDGCGDIGSQDDRTLVAFARSKGIRILPSLLTSTGPTNHDVLTDPDAASHAAEQIVAYVVSEGYDGFDLDLEGVAPEDRDALTAFVARVSAGLHAQGKTLVMAVPAKARETTTGWAGAYDYAALAPHVDLFVIMTYGYTIATSDPGSTAPYEWVDSVIGYVTTQIPAEKVLVGLAFYAYDWNVTSGARARSFRYPSAAALANWYGATIQIDPDTRSAYFGYTSQPGDQPSLPTPYSRPDHEIVSHNRPYCPKTPPPPPPGPTSTPTPLPTEAEDHVVWLENRDSAAARLEIVDRHGAAGVAGWRLGQEDPEIWSLLAEWK